LNLKPHTEKTVTHLFLQWLLQVTFSVLKPLKFNAGRLWENSISLFVTESCEMSEIYSFGRQNIVT